MRYQAEEVNTFNFVVTEEDDYSITFPVLLLSGQSNALGQLTDPVLANLPAEYQGAQPRIDIWWEGDYITYDPNNGRFESMEPVVNTRNPFYTNGSYPDVGWSVEQRCSHLFLDDYSKLYVIKSAFGGLKISEWASPSGSRWVELKRYILNAITWLENRNQEPSFIGMMWMQGESDILEGVSQADYQASLETLMSDIRGLSSYLTNLKFYFSEIPTNKWGDQTIVNKSFANVIAADSYSYWIDTSAYAHGYDVWPDGHYDAQNLLDIGTDLYNKIKGNTNPELHTDANAASDPNGNEADATTGWTPTNLSGTGANVFESQSSVKSKGGYALHANANDTPTAGANFSKTFPVEDGETYTLSYHTRHVGVGLTWRLNVDGSGISFILVSETEFYYYEYSFVASGSTAVIMFEESSGSSSGGIYLDNLSLKKSI